MLKVLLIALAAAALLLHLIRQYWTHRALPQRHRARFDGEIYRVGDTVIARRPARDASDQTIIGFPGFLEDMRYFQALYADFDGELILVNNANYHSPFPSDDAQELAWPNNPFALGTIQHDGFILGQVVKKLASGNKVTLHGHSRGGAVVLEAGRQFPTLMRSDEREVSAILEAPVLPGGRPIGRMDKPWALNVACYALPIVLGLLRSGDEERLLKQPMMRPTNKLKTELCRSLYSVARNYSTCVTNVRSISHWQRNTPAAVFENYEKITVVVGARDDVLDNDSLIASAELGQQLNPGVEIMHTKDTNHFVSLEAPSHILACYSWGSAEHNCHY